jgi:hypothetical protein
MPSIRFSWWNVKWMFKLPKRNTMKSQNNTRFWMRV